MACRGRIACLKSGAVKESAELVRIDPISGPGVCGAEYPLKVAALGENISSFGFADESLRPPGSIGNQPRWPITRAPAAAAPPKKLSRETIKEIIGKPFGKLSESGAAPAELCRAVERPDLAVRAGHRPAGG